MSNIRLFASFNPLRTLGQRPTAQFTTPDASGNITVQGNRLVLPFNANVFSGSGDVFEYQSAVGNLGTSLNTAIPLNTVECRYDNQLNRVVLRIFGGSSPVFDTISFNASAQKLYGLEASYTSQSIITGSRAPAFVWTSTQALRAKDTDVREQSSFIDERIADSGRTYSVGRPSVAQERNWSFINELKANVFKQAALEAANPDITYSWQEFVENVRASDDIFILIDNNESVGSNATLTYEDREAVYKLKPQSMNFRPQELFPNFDEYWNVNVQTRVYNAKWRDGKIYPPGTYCPIPQGVNAVNPANGVENVSIVNQDTLSWSYISGEPTSDIIGAFVYFGTDPSFPEGEIADISPPTTSVDISSFLPLDGGQQYFWRIETYNMCGSRTDDFGFITFNPNQNIEIGDANLSPFVEVGSGTTDGPWGWLGGFQGGENPELIKHYAPHAPRKVGFPSGSFPITADDGLGHIIIEPGVTNKILNSIDGTTWANPGEVYIVSASAAPDNTWNAWKMEKTGSGTSGVRPDINITRITPGTWDVQRTEFYTLGSFHQSIFVKKDESSNSVFAWRGYNHFGDLFWSFVNPKTLAVSSSQNLHFSVGGDFRTLALPTGSDGEEWRWLSLVMSGASEALHFHPAAFDVTGWGTVHAPVDYHTGSNTVFAPQVGTLVPMPSTLTGEGAGTPMFHPCYVPTSGSWQEKIRDAKVFSIPSVKLQKGFGSTLVIENQRMDGKQKSAEEVMIGGYDKTGLRPLFEHVLFDYPYGLYLSRSYFPTGGDPNLTLSGSYIPEIHTTAGVYTGSLLYWDWANILRFEMDWDEEEMRIFKSGVHWETIPISGAFSSGAPDVVENWRCGHSYRNNPWAGALGPRIEPGIYRLWLTASLSGSV